MKTNIKMVTTALMMALMCAAAAVARPNNVKAEGKLAVRDVLTADISKDVTGRYVKRQASEEEVQNKVSAVKAQISDPVDGVRHIRFVAAIDSYLYDTAKFNIVAKNGEEVVKTFADKEVTTAYTHIEANGKVLSAAEAFNDESYNYMVAYTINNVPEEAWGYNFEVSVSIKTVEAEDFTTSEVANKVINKVEFEDKTGAGVVEIVNDATYPWTMEMVDGVATLASTNAGNDAKNTEAKIIFTAIKDTIVTFDWYVSSEKTYDYLNVKVGEVNIVNRQGNPDGVLGTVAQMINAGESIEFMYRKDSSGNKGEDRAVITNLYFTDGIPAVEITKVFNDGVTPNDTVTGGLLDEVGAEVLAAPANVRGENYEFDAWYYDAEFTQKAQAEDIHKKENVTLYANWKQKATVNFVVPEGATPVDSMNVWTYEALDVANPSKDMHIFRGWFADADYTTPVDLTKGVVESCTLYGKFEELPLGSTKEAANVISFANGQYEWKTNATTTEEFQNYYFKITPTATEKFIFVCENYSKVGGTAQYAYYNRMWIETEDGNVVVSDFNGKEEVVLEAGITYYAIFHGSKYASQYTSWGTFDLTVYNFAHDTAEEAIPMTIGTSAEIPVGTFTSKYETMVYSFTATETTGLRFLVENNHWAQYKVYANQISGSAVLTKSLTKGSAVYHLDVVEDTTYYIVVSNNWNSSELADGTAKLTLLEYAKGYTSSNPNNYVVGETIETNFEGGREQYFAFNIETEDVYKLSMNGGQATYVKNVEIFAADNLTNALFKLSGSDDAVDYVKLPVGNYMMKIYYTSTDGTTTPFSVALTSAEIGESILKPSSATLPNNNEVIAEITAAGYYQFTTGDDVLFHFFGTDDSLVVIEIYDANGELVATSTNGEVFKKLSANTTYILHVDAPAVVNYHTEVGVKDGKSVDTAYDISVGVNEVPTTVDLSGQEVWYCFEITEAGVYQLYATNVNYGNGTTEYVDTKGFVYAADGKTAIASDDDTGPTPNGGHNYDFWIKSVELDVGTYYFKLKYYQINDAKAGVPLTVTIELA